MRFIHTSDWHLGRLFHGVHLTDDQAHVLDELVRLVSEAKADALLVAGDVYDRAVPPPEAVALLDDFLVRVVVDAGVRVVMMAGNHDSPQRLAFGSRLFEARGLHLVGYPEDAARPMVFEDDDGPVSVFAIPYAEPALVRERLEDEGVRDHGSALAAVMETVRGALPGGHRSVVMAHVFAAGSEESESERPLSVGGSGAVETSAFGGIDYVALGHLHRCQQAGSGRIRYSGSPLKYSFSEAAHGKSVSVVEMDAAGRCTVEEVELSAHRDVRVIRGSIAEICAGPDSGENRDDYVLAEISDRGAVLDAIGKVREVYPNCLHIDRSAFFAGSDGSQPSRERIDHRRHSEDELFRAFFEEVTGETIPEDEAEVFADVVDGLRRSQREAGGAA